VDILPIPPAAHFMSSVSPGRFLAAAAVAITAACTSLPPPAASAPPVVVDTLWYISARARAEGRDTRRLTDSLEFGIVVTARPVGRDPLVADLDLAVVDSVRLSEAGFISTLAERAREVAAGTPPAVLSVHGFGTSLHEAWDHGAQAQVRSRSRGPWVVFAWPSNGAGVTWPRRGQLFSRAYREDSASAVASRAAFARGARVVLDAVGGARLLVVAHSLGAQLVGEALASDSVLRARLGADPLRALAFFAPDVETNRFGDVYVPSVAPLARRVVLYAAADDRLLTMSRLVNGSDRAGLHIGRPPLVRAGLETVDVTAGLSAESWLLRVFGTHHALRRASAALFDLMHVVGGGHPAECREALGTAVPHEDGGWRLTPDAPPPIGSVGGCAGASATARPQ
jgi:hypothetical protein